MTMVETVFSATNRYIFRRRGLAFARVRVFFFRELAMKSEREREREREGEKGIKKGEKKEMRSSNIER